MFYKTLLSYDYNCSNKGRFFSTCWTHWFRLYDITLSRWRRRFAGELAASKLLVWCQSIVYYFGCLGWWQSIVCCFAFAAINTSVVVDVVISIQPYCCLWFVTGFGWQWQLCVSTNYTGDSDGVCGRYHAKMDVGQTHGDSKNTQPLPLLANTCPVSMTQ